MFEYYVTFLRFSEACDDSGQSVAALDAAVGHTAQSGCSYHSGVRPPAAVGR